MGGGVDLLLARPAESLVEKGKSELVPLAVALRIFGGHRFGRKPEWWPGARDGDGTSWNPGAEEAGSPFDHADDSVGGEPFMHDDLSRLRHEDDLLGQRVEVERVVPLGE